jgi:proteasome lid subunit RPN8/RPN11
MDAILDALRAHAALAAPAECCGLALDVEGRTFYVPCINHADDPAQRFSIAPEDYADAEDHGRVTMICHSHTTGGAEASDADVAGCNASGIPWLILSHPDGATCVINPGATQWKP